MLGKDNGVIFCRFLHDLVFRVFFLWFWLPPKAKELSPKLRRRQEKADSCLSRGYLCESERNRLATKGITYHRLAERKWRNKILNNEDSSLIFNRQLHFIKNFLIQNWPLLTSKVLDGTHHLSYHIFFIYVCSMHNFTFNNINFPLH